MTRGSVQISRRGWWALPGALVSFEAVFVIFLFAGNYKADPRLASVPIDLSICFFAVGFAMGLVIIYREGMYLPGLTLVAVAGAFVTWAVLSYLWTPSTVYAQQKLIKLTVLNLWCLIATAMIIANRPERVRRLLLLLLVFGIAASVDGMVRYATAEGAAFSAGFRLENYLGQGRLYGLGALVAFAAWLHADPISRRGMVLMAAFATCLYAMLIAGARGPIVSVGAAMLLPLALGVRFADRRLFASKAWLTSLVLFLVMAVVIAHLAIVSGDSLRAFQRFNVLLTQEGGGNSVAGRLLAWPETLALWAQQPVIGQGVGSWPVLYYGKDIGWYPHNLFLEVLCEFGLIGLLLLTAVVAVGCQRVTRERLRAEPVMMTAAMLTIATFFYSMTSGDLADNRTLFAMLGLLAMRSTRKAMHAGTEHRPSYAGAPVPEAAAGLSQAFGAPRPGTRPPWAR